MKFVAPVTAIQGAVASSVDERGTYAQQIWRNEWKEGRCAGQGWWEHKNWWGQKGADNEIILA